LTTPSKEYQDLYHAGVAAARARDFDRARKLFLAAVTLDEGQKSGWLALARLETDPAAKVGCYRRVLSIDPEDAVARAFVDGMRHAQPWYRSRLIVGLVGLLALLLGGTFALIVTRPGLNSGAALPTAAHLPTLTPGLGIELAVPLNDANAALTASPALEETALPGSPVLQPQVTFISLGSPTSEAATGTPSATTAPPAAPTSTLPPPPTTVLNPPPPGAPSHTPGSPMIVTVVTSAPTFTNIPGTTPTQQPLFEDITEPPPTNLPVFVTPTLDYQGDFNTEVPPTDQTFPEDPNSGGIPGP
jgi:hypothetical protein